MRNNTEESPLCVCVCVHVCHLSDLQFSHSSVGTPLQCSQAAL